MEVAILRIPEGVPQWHVVASFLRLRKDVFIGKLDWQLNHSEAMEFEQYDRVDAVYVIAHENGSVFGGARLLSTDRRVGVYSYMLLDAFHGLLSGIPNELCDLEPPRRNDVWELTRLAALKSGDIASRVLKNGKGDVF